MRSIETAGQAAIVGGVLNVGGVEIPVGQDVDHVWVYVRRWPHDLTVSEVLIAFHNGPAAELLDNQNAEAARFPLGEKEYWRGEMVGLYSWGDDDHLMTDEDYEKYWMEFE